MPKKKTLPEKKPKTAGNPGPKKIEWTNARRSIKELLPAEYNPRQMNEKQAAALGRSLKKFSLAEPVVINLNGTIVGGHQRIHLLADSGATEVDVRVPNRLLTDKEEKELNLRLNGNNGEWDFDALINNFDLDFLKEAEIDDKDMRALEAMGSGVTEGLEEGAFQDYFNKERDSFTISLNYPKKYEKKFQEYMKANGKEPLEKLVLKHICP